MNAKSINSTFPDSLKFTVNGSTSDLALSVATIIEVNIRNLVGLASSANTGFSVQIVKPVVETVYSTNTTTKQEEEVEAESDDQEDKTAIEETEIKEKDSVSVF